jgi:uncharacterized membrane protein
MEEVLAGIVGLLVFIVAWVVRGYIRLAQRVAWLEAKINGRADKRGP